MRSTGGHPSPQRLTEPLVLSLEEMSRQGEALARCGDKPVYVFGGIAGEVVEAEVLKVRRDYIAARTVKVLKPSPHRVAAPCPYFDPCTGCQWQHIDYPHQLELKRQRVQQELQQVGGFAEPPVLPTLPSPAVWGYRNHARFSVGPQGRLGFVGKETRQSVAVERCLIMHPRVNELLGQLQGRCDETRQVTVRVGVNADSYLIQPALRRPSLAVETGQRTYDEALLGRRFRVASPSFFQVNVAQTEQLIGLVRERLHLQGDEVLVDAYSGVGTFAVLLTPFVRRVVAIEESRAAVKDAQANLAGIANVELCLGKTEEALLNLGQAPDVLILDPPRTGCHPQALEAVKRLAPKRVVYISCDLVTLARDLKRLCDGTYRLVEVQPVDMFPHTHHVEAVAVLALEEGDVGGGTSLVLASSSPRRREIMGEMGLGVRIVPPQVSEPPPDGAQPEEYVQRTALAKAEWVARSGETGVIIAGDTVVVDGSEVLGKPHRPAEAEAMLRRLRGRQHRVMTGLAVIDVATGRRATTCVTSQVTMRSYSERELQRFVASGLAMDKAGAYAVQDETFRPAESVEGCYLNVVGLPACALLELLRQVGVRVTPRKGWRPSAQCSSCPLQAKEMTT